jgi:hypothetical protein
LQVSACITSLRERDSAIYQVTLTFDLWLWFWLLTFDWLLTSTWSFHCPVKSVTKMVTCL